MDTVIMQNELRMTCTQELNRLLFAFLGAKKLNSAPEEQLTQNIKLVAVRGLDKKV